MLDDDRLPAPQEILDTHEELEVAYDMKYRGIRTPFTRRKLRSVIDGAAEDEDAYDRAAFLLKRLISIHVFEDGNKRTAFVVVIEYRWRHGLAVAVTPHDNEAPQILRSIGRNEVDELGTWLRSGDIDRSKLNPDGGRFISVNPLLVGDMSDPDVEAVGADEHRKRVRAIIDEYRELLDALQ